MAAVNNNAATLNQLTSMLNQVQGIANANGVATGGGAAAAPAAGGTVAPQAGAAGAAGADGPLTIPGTGKAEVRVINGVTKYFAAAPVGQLAKEITAYQYAEKNVMFKVDLDHRDGIAAGLANLGNIFSARQERLRLLSNALANDANNGVINAADMARLQQENATSENIMGMTKKLFDTAQNVTQMWLR